MSLKSLIMKKTLLCLICGVVLVCLSGTGWAQSGTIEKKTFLYSVQESDSLRLDRYDNPDAQGDRPCVIFMFGGGFYTGSRDQSSYLPYFHFLVEQGYCVVSIDYRLGMKNLNPADETNLEAFVGVFGRAIEMAVTDLYDATAYVLARATEWNVDPKGVIACGSSAGAISVLMGEYGLCNRSEAAKALLPAGFNYAGVISFAGAIFSQGQPQWAGKPCPIQMFHGDADANVPYDQVSYEGIGFYGSKYLAGQLTTMQSPHYFYSVENATHTVATTPMDDNREAILAFLNKLVRQQQPLILNTTQSQIGQAAKPKDFTIMDYIRSNFAPSR